MARYDRVLIDPAQNELGLALRQAVDCANDKRKQRLLAWPVPDWQELLEELGQPSGFRQFNGGDGPARGGEGRSAVALAWWTDRAGRKHHRVVGRHGLLSRPMLDNLLCPFGSPRPPLWFVYPDHVFLAHQADDRSPRAMCTCGAFGHPDELGWMGSCCDGCYDLGLEGQTPTSAWLDPRQSTLRGEEGRLACLAYSPDGRVLATGSAHDEIALWDVETGLERGRLRAGDGEWVVCVGWTADGQRIVTADVLGRLRYYGARTGLPTGEEISTGHAECFGISMDGAFMGRGSRSGVTLMAASNGSVIRELEGNLRGVSCLAFSPYSAVLAAGNRQGRLALWDVTTGEKRGEHEVPGAIVTSLAFAPDGQTLAVGLHPAPQSESTQACRVLLWDVAETRVGGVLAGNEGGTRTVAWAPDGRVLASGGEDGLVRLWDVNSRRERLALEWHLDCVCSLAFAPDGLTLATAGFDGMIKLWPREALRPLARKREMAYPHGARGI